MCRQVLHSDSSEDSNNPIYVRKIRFSVFILLCVLIPLGFATKWYQGPAAEWMHRYAGDILYPMFWYFVGVFLVPRANPWVLGLLVLACSTVVEFTQLFNTPLLEWLRQSFIGRTLVGVSFSVTDIVYYVVGSLLAVVVHMGLNFLVFPAPASKP